MKISTKRWDEWLLAPVTDTVSAESELSGIIACMKTRSDGDQVELALPRLWVFRRVRRLWPRVSWSAERELTDILRLRGRRVLQRFVQFGFRGFGRLNRLVLQGRHLAFQAFLFPVHVFDLGEKAGIRLSQPALVGICEKKQDHQLF